MKKIPLIYIASPYSTGDAFLNTREQILWADTLNSMGAVGLWPLHSAFHNLVIPHDYEYWMNLDYQIIWRCNALLRLDGQSPGADLEVNFAIRTANIPVFNQHENTRLKKWIDEF